MLANIHKLCIKEIDLIIDSNNPDVFIMTIGSAVNPVIYLARTQNHYLLLHHNGIVKVDLPLYKGLRDDINAYIAQSL